MLALLRSQRGRATAEKPWPGEVEFGLLYELPLLKQDSLLEENSSAILLNRIMRVIDH